MPTTDPSKSKKSITDEILESDHVSEEFRAMARQAKIIGTENEFKRRLESVLELKDSDQSSEQAEPSQDAPSDSGKAILFERSNPRTGWARAELWPRLEADLQKSRSISFHEIFEAYNKGTGENPGDDLKRLLLNSFCGYVNKKKTKLDKLIARQDYEIKAVVLEVKRRM